ncbi:hypothetical protein [Myceligenerans pegani]|uniref:Uncharacterized protein n=1 Tax=Myceligenerans pegani TaxID=2776917 RepID=A0ABR9MXK3_9MICO|nr:hypothetical protein [Myceligenerans sp. TRM 65318]MBE1876107.1 hypothetical protein [Myceligenerans sp. TRM 65318]MBE3018378.1 hypothetical protein [Myceligenerans sp. TRM 65318]
MNPLLYGFWIMPAFPGATDPRPIPGLDQLGRPWAVEALKDWASENEVDALIEGKSARLQTPNESTADSPSIWACIIDRTIEAQTESTLSALAMLLERQLMSQQLIKKDEFLADYPTRAAHVDADAIKSIGDVVRMEGWRSAARAIRARAEAVNYSLHVEYRSPSFTVEDVRRRMPIVRHVYNSVPGVRDSIDRIVHSMTSGWHIKGPGPESALQRVRDAIESSGIQELTALCARDALVCGVGALSLGPLPLRAAWLIRPENILDLNLDEGSALAIAEDGSRQEMTGILGIRGSTQSGLATGLSLLEPMVITSANRDLYLYTLLNARVIAELSRDSAVTSRAAMTRQVALHHLREMSNQSSIFNPVVSRISVPPQDMYGEGREEMAPAVDHLGLGAL